MEISKYSDSSNWSQRKMKLSHCIWLLQKPTAFLSFLIILHLNASLQGLMLHQAVLSAGFSEPSGRSGDCAFAAPVLVCPSSRGLPRLVFNSQTQDPVDLWSSFSVALSPLVLCSTHSSCQTLPHSSLCLSASASALWHPCPTSWSGKCLQEESQGSSLMDHSSVRLLCNV